VRDVTEKSDARRVSGGPGQQGHRGTSSRSPAEDGRAPKASRFAKPVAENATSARDKGHRERHADKRQPEDSGPGRASKSAPQRGRFDWQ
jgi:hypothetical protein